jgi:hypothetical protein
LRHDWPEGTQIAALVDVKLLLENLKHEQTQTGEWVNVIGYISPTEQMAKRHQFLGSSATQQVHVQALLLWSAGPLKLGRYEHALEKFTPAAKPDDAKGGG